MITSFLNSMFCKIVLSIKWQPECVHTYNFTGPLSGPLTMENILWLPQGQPPPDDDSGTIDLIFIPKPFTRPKAPV